LLQQAVGSAATLGAAFGFLRLKKKQKTAATTTRHAKSCRSALQVPAAA
jgi:hypothetical protein